MAVSFDLEASKRFLEALENMRRPQGEGLRSDVRGEVPQSLADEFRALMEESAPRPDAVSGAAEPGRVNVAAAPEGVRPVEGAAPRTNPRASAACGTTWRRMRAKDSGRPALTP